MCSNKNQLATICTGYASIGAIFMSWVGLMMKNQPFYIKGLDFHEEEEIRCKDSAIFAMFLFIAILMISIVYLRYEKFLMRRELTYDAVDTTAFDAGLPPGMTDYIVRDTELI